MKKIFESLQNGFAILVALFFFGAFLGLVVEPLSPVITIIAVLVFTINTFDRWQTAAASVAGIVLYGVSWYVCARWGYWTGMSFWFSGILIWFIAVIWPLLRRKSRYQNPLVVGGCRRCTLDPP